jgi:hypothetical protein
MAPDLAPDHAYGPQGVWRSSARRGADLRPRAGDSALTPFTILTPPHPPPGFNSYIYQSIALDARIPNIQNLIDLTLVIQKLCFLHPPALL